MFSTHSISASHPGSVHRPGATDRSSDGEVPIHADLVILGGGAAGLSAAISAAARMGEAAQNIVIVESAARLGGAARMSGGGMCLVGTDLQRRNGVTDGVKLALSDWEAVGGPSADLEWARAYLSDSNEELFVWLAQLGLRWQTLNRQEANTVARWHAPVGAGPAVVQALTDRLNDLPVLVVTAIRATNLLFNAGATRGVEVQTPSGRQEIRTSTVIVTTGGFVANPQMVREAASARWAGVRVLSGGAPTAVGQGHRMLSASGAIFDGLDRMAVYPVGTPNSHSGDPDKGVVIRGITNDVWVNQDGKRFHDERLRGGASGGGAIRAQPGATFWGIADAQGTSNVKINGDEYFGLGDEIHVDRVQEFLRQSPYIKQADTIEELASAAGLPADVVVSSVEAYNREVREEEESAPPASESLTPATRRQPIEKAPFTSIQYFPIAQKNLGGVVTDLGCRVLDSSRMPIPGLYAAGEVAGMGGGHINGDGALEGTMLGPSLYSGKIAGRSAADYILSNIESSRSTT